MLHTLGGDVFQNHNLDDASLTIAGKSQPIFLTSHYHCKMRYIVPTFGQVIVNVFVLGGRGCSSPPYVCSECIAVFN
jgi:hypothetical protein